MFTLNHTELTNGPLSGDDCLEGDHLAGVHDQILGWSHERHNLLLRQLLLGGLFLVGDGEV